MGVFGYFGGTENGTSGARIKILRPLFNTNDINNHLRSLDLFRSMISRTIDKKFVMITPSPPVHHSSLEVDADQSEARLVINQSDSQE